MAAELVDVEVTFDGKVIETFASRFDPDRSDLDLFLKDVATHVGPSKHADAVQIWRRRASLGIYHLATGREIKQ
jgi:hypothetical protein